MKTSQAETYQGYKNYETFSVAVTIANDQIQYNEWRRRATAIKTESATVKHDVWTSEEYVRFTLADALKEWHEVNNPVDGINDVYSSLMNAALECVLWVEVADEILQGLE